jgi:hypothetical protein
VRTAAIAIGLLGAGLVASPTAFAQSCARFGDHMYVNIETLTDRAEQFNGQCLRTRGRLVLRGRSRPQEGALRGSWMMELKDPETGQTVFIVPNAGVAERFNYDGLSIVGRIAEVAGVLRSSPEFPSPTIYFMGYEVAPRPTEPGPGRSPTPTGAPTPAPTPPPTPTDRTPDGLLTACDVVGAPEAYLGQKIVVWAPFRGRNAFRDLPDETRPDADAWVVGDEDCAVWVTGRAPAGEGFSLETASPAARWVKVEGKLERRAEALVLKASKVLLARPRD